MSGIQGDAAGYAAETYKDRLATQDKNYPDNPGISWLLEIPELYESRAPGTTCLSAIHKGCTGTIENPINNSKGCGGIMRVAPIGLYYDVNNAPIQAAEAAALTLLPKGTSRRGAPY